MPKAVQLSAYGGVDQLRLVEVPKPEPDPLLPKLEPEPLLPKLEPEPPLLPKLLPKLDPLPLPNPELLLPNPELLPPKPEVCCPLLLVVEPVWPLVPLAPVVFPPVPGSGWGKRRTTSPIASLVNARL